MSLRAYVPTCDSIHYLRLLGADCSKFGMLLVITSYYCGRIHLIVYILQRKINSRKIAQLHYPRKTMVMLKLNLKQKLMKTES